MITSLNIKNVTSYNALNGVDIKDLKKVNFFFGFNGSGKSTIAKYLRNLSLKNTEQNSVFNQCSNIGYENSQHQILTFNEEFIEENFRKSADFKGVFSLNQSNVIIDQQITDEEFNIQNYKTLREKYERKIKGIGDEKKLNHDSILNYCWNQRTAFAAFTKISLAYSGSKSNHLQEIRRILQNPLNQILTIQELTEKYQNLYEKELREIKLTINAKNYSEIRRIEIKIEKLLQEVIVGNEDVDIAGLIQTLNARNWVEQGIKYLDTSNNICPFCQNETINADLIEQFNNFFDETYKKKISEIENLKEHYKQKIDLFVADLNNIQNVFNPNNLVSNLVIALNALFEENIKTIEDKIEHSNERKSIATLQNKKSDLKIIKSLIKNNNELFENVNSSKEDFNKEIWNHLANDSLQEIEKYDIKINKYTRLLALASELMSKYENEIVTANQNIENLRSETVNTKEAVDNTNLILKNTGFEGFEIAEKDKVNNISRYYLKRPNNTSPNSVFNSLSEGEKNFISFLYFYQLCLGTDDCKTIVVKRK